MKTCLDCIYHDRCDTIFDGLLSNRDNKPCDQFDDRNYYAKLPAYIGMKIWIPWVYPLKEGYLAELREGKVSGLQQKVDGSWKIRCSRDGSVSDYAVDEFNERVFLTEEAAKEYINNKIAEYTKN